MHKDAKRILMLGGNFLQISAIERAKELGYYVITADYLPDNPGHKYSDEYHNVSTTDKEGIYKLAKELKVDGILSYASDVSAPAAAYACEKLGLPTNPYESSLRKRISIRPAGPCLPILMRRAHLLRKPIFPLS